MVEELFKNMHLQLSEEDIRKVDEWKRSRGMKSRTEAIRAMIRMVTGNEKTEAPAKKTLSENNSDMYRRPSVPMSDKENNESVEELIRKVVKEELKNYKS